MTDYNDWCQQDDDRWVEAMIKEEQQFFEEQDSAWVIRQEKEWKRVFDGYTRKINEAKSFKEYPREVVEQWCDRVQAVFFAWKGWLRNVDHAPRRKQWRRKRACACLQLLRFERTHRIKANIIDVYNLKCSYIGE